jgi:quinoprotein glucose dehydrogenase
MAEGGKAGNLLVRLVAAALVLSGLGLLAGGGQLLLLGGSPYYVASGAALFVSGILLWRKRRLGSTIYGYLLLATLAWAIWEAGIDGWALAPRLGLPLVVGLVLATGWVQSALDRPSPPGTWWRRAGAAIVAVALGAGLRAVAPPHMPVDPIGQAGRTTLAATTVAADANASGDWAHYGNDPGGLRFSPLSQITPRNVSKLEVAWTAHAGQSPWSHEATPLKVGDTVYICTSDNNIVALNAETGAQRWRFDSHTNAQLSSPVCRGLAYYRAPNATGPCAESVYTATVDARLLAVDARTGAPCQGFGAGGQVSLLTGLGPVERGYYIVSSPPQLVRGKLVVDSHVADNQMMGEPSGVIRAYDAVTGKLAWAWDMGQPQRTGEPPAGDSYTRGTPNAWPPMSADETLGLVFIPLGNATPDYFGANRRPFDEQYTDAVVALDAETGRPRWSFQTTHHDLWDYDIPSQPTAADIIKDGKPVKALLTPTKRGELFVLDRQTGAPIFPVQERSVPQAGKAPEDHLSPTQPYSTGLPSFRGPDLTETTMWGITPFDQLACRIKFRKARYQGEFTPPGLTPAIQYPGDAGGMEWGSVTVDVARNIVVAPTNYVAIYTRLVPRAEAIRLGLKPFTAKTAAHADEGFRVPQEKTPYGALVGPFFSPLLALPCNQPPYGRLSAIDLNTGKLLWSRAVGTGRDGGPLGIKSQLPFTMGTPLWGGAITTRSGLTFIGGAQDGYLRAYETATGKLLWEHRLPAGGNATPMSYVSPESGRQFIVIYAGGYGGLQTRMGDYVVAFALPKSAGR